MGAGGGSLQAGGGVDGRRGSSPERFPTIDSLRTGYQGVFLLLSKGFTKPPRGGQSRKMPVARTVSPKERAERWAAMIDGDVVKTRADLARKLGVSRARVTQVLAMASLTH